MMQEGLNAIGLSISKTMAKAVQLVIY